MKGFLHEKAFYNDDDIVAKVEMLERKHGYGLGHFLDDIPILQFDNPN